MNVLDSAFEDFADFFINIFQAPRSNYLVTIKSLLSECRNEPMKNTRLMKQLGNKKIQFKRALADCYL